MERAYIPLNVANIVSITIMAAAGMIVLGAITASLKAYRG